MSSSRLRSVDLLLVAAGGAVGALARVGIDTAAPDSLFPWPTLAVNVVGAFLLGLLPVLAAVRHSRRVAVALGPGRARRFHDGLRLGRGRAGAGRCRTCRGGRALPRGDAGRRPGRRRPRPEDVAPAGARGCASNDRAARRPRRRGRRTVALCLGGRVRRPLAARHPARQHGGLGAASAASRPCPCPTRPGPCSARASAARSRRSRPSPCSPSTARHAMRRRTSSRRSCWPSVPACWAGRSARA